MIGWACAQPFPTLAMPLAAASTTEEDILNKGNATVDCFDWCYTSIYIAEAQRTDYLKSLGMSAGLRAF